jgi:hypothetical protein
MIQIDRLRMMASEAILEYQSALTGGSEPLYPQWADDLLVVCERAEASLPTNPTPARRRAEQREYSFSAA